MEVYNECVYDLLVPPSEGHDKLQIQKREKDVVVPVSGLPSKYCVPSIICTLVHATYMTFERLFYYHIFGMVHLW